MLHNKTKTIPNQQKSNAHYFLAFLADWVTLALLLFWAVLVFQDMALSNSLCCFLVNDFLYCPIFSKLFIAFTSEGELNMFSLNKFIQSYRI